jgi:amino acid efflux transporter
MSSISFALAVLGWLSIEFQIGAASACFTAVTAFGLAAGVRLLPRRTAAWYGVVMAAVVMLVVLLFSGWALLVPAGLGAAAFLAGRRPSRRLLPQHGEIVSRAT